MLTPLDIQNKEFKKGIRGYKEDEVDEFLDEVMINYEKLFKENAELKDKIENAQQQVEQYKNLEHTLKNTLVVAQSTAEEVKSSALKKSQLIIEEAELRAKEIIDLANKDVAQVRNEYEEVKRHMELFKIRYKTLLQSQLESLLESKEELQEG